jgi:hypothetical protein
MPLRLITYMLAILTIGGLVGAPVVSARRLAPAKPLEAIWRARVQGTSADPAISGTAEYVLVAVTPLHRFFGVEVSHAGKYSGQRLGVYLSGEFVGWMRVGSLGRAQLSRSTGSNQPVPELGTGGVAIKTRSGICVARGRLLSVS